MIQTRSTSQASEVKLRKLYGVDHYVDPNVKPEKTGGNAFW